MSRVPKRRAVLSRQREADEAEGWWARFVHERILGPYCCCCMPAFVELECMADETGNELRHRCFDRTRPGQL